MQIRAAIYKAFPYTPCAELDSMELWQIGVRMGHDMGAPLSDDERAEAERLKATQSDRLREVAERRKGRR